VWEHRDPGNASYRVTGSDGTIYTTGSAELDPLGTDAGTSNPIPNPTFKSFWWSYPGFGNTNMSGDSQCTLNGDMVPCWVLGYAKRTQPGFEATVYDRNAPPGFGAGVVPIYGWQYNGSPGGDDACKNGVCPEVVTVEDPGGYFEIVGYNLIANAVAFRRLAPPPVDVDGVRNNIAGWLSNRDCSSYVTKLISEAARQNRGNPAVSIDPLELFDKVRKQGGFVRLQVGTHKKPSLATISGFIPKNSATVYLPPIKIYPDSTVKEITVGSLSLDSMGAFHELIHLAGSKWYTDIELSRAARVVGGPTLPTDKDNRNLAFSRYFNDELKRNCGIR
jgi:hypothetical protein